MNFLPLDGVECPGAVGDANVEVGAGLLGAARPLDDHPGVDREAGRVDLDRAQVVPVDVVRPGAHVGGRGLAHGGDDCGARCWNQSLGSCADVGRLA